MAADISPAKPASQPERGPMLSYPIQLVGMLVAIILIGLFLTPVELALSWLLILVLMATFILVAGKQVTSLWRGALIDERNKISLSRLQLILWTIIVLSAYLCAAMANVAADVAEPLAITIPKQLWIALGISTTSLVGSPLITSTKKVKKPDSNQEAATIKAAAAGNKGKIKAEGLILENVSKEDARWADVFSGEETGNGASLDLSKIQMFFFTAVILIAYAFAIAAGFESDAGTAVVSLPGIDSSMNALLGISHTGYLTHKAIPLSKEGAA